MLNFISKPFHFIQSHVDSVGMYRMVSGTLGVLAGLAIFFGFIGLIPYSGLSQVFSLILALFTALLVNVIFSFILKVPANHESAVITAFILFFLALPEENIFNTWPLMAAVAIGVASKYVIAYKKQHFLNPAAFGAAALSVSGVYSFSWWVANPVMFIPLLLCGILVVMKVRKWVPVLGLIGVSLLVYLAESVSYGTAVTDALRTFFISWPTLFLAFYMLTEPFTMPAEKGPQFLYGGLVGFLLNTSLFVGFISFSPELALVVANAVMLPSRLRQKLFLVLEEKRLIAKNTYEFVFKKPAGFSYKSGQYLEWMLPHVNPDSKGIRRYFTIASSPTEDHIRVAMKITDNASTYKEMIKSLGVAHLVIASQLAGDFLLPKDTTAKLAFIAGGIGVTPFSSHIKWMLDSGKAHDTVLYYCVNNMSELAYEDIWSEAARTFTFTFIPVVAKDEAVTQCEIGYITADMIKRRTPDYLERIWYLSGPPSMVNAYERLLKEIGVKRSHIKTDFFPGA